MSIYDKEHKSIADRIYKRKLQTRSDDQQGRDCRLVFTELSEDQIKHSRMPHHQIYNQPSDSGSLRCNSQMRYAVSAPG